MVYTLIGMPGSGKSCMGRALSRRLKIKNIDSDKLIQRVAGKRLIDIIREDGMSAFRELEERVLLGFCKDNVVLSTGGSAVYYPEAMVHLRSLGPIIYLYCSYEVIAERLGDFSERGVVLRSGQTLRDLYDERSELYKKYADITVDCSGKHFAKYRERIISALRYYINSEN